MKIPKRSDPTPVKFVVRLEHFIEQLELEHYMKCNRCGDLFDMRNFTRVSAHEVCERFKPFKQGESI